MLVDGRIPVDRNTKKPLYSHCKDVSELWVPLIEKAYAKLLGCYDQLNFVSFREAFQTLTG